jgi:hypothetical protein
VTWSSWIRPVNARAGYRRPARQRRGPGPWCLRSSPKRRKASATATHTRPLRCPSHHLENPCNVLVGWVSEPQKRHRKRDNAGTAMGHGHGQPPSRLSGSRSASPLQRQRASDSTAPVLPALVTSGCRPRFGPSPSPQGFSPVATIKGGQAEPQREKSRRRAGKATVLAKPESAVQCRCMHA